VRSEFAPDSSTDRLQSSRRLSDATGRASEFHRQTIEEPSHIRMILERLVERGTPLANGMDHRNRPRSLRVVEVGSSTLVLEQENVDPSRQRELYLSFDLDGIEYFLATKFVDRKAGGRLEVRVPDAIHAVERRSEARDRFRKPVDSRPIEIQSAGQSWTGFVLDSSVGGVGIRVPANAEIPTSGSVRMREIEGDGSYREATVRHAVPSESGWIRLGLALSSGEDSLIAVERRERILERGVAQRARDQAGLARDVLRVLPRRLVARAGRQASESCPRVVTYPNSQGQPIRAILDHTGDPRGAPAIVIPPAWGRTKETLLPLAQSLIRTFESAGKSLLVLRFDGTHRRGESYVDPECRRPGDETLRFTYSQAARDVQSSIEFLRNGEFETAAVVLATFSLASIDGRRAVADDRSGVIVGWVSVVGMADVQSAMRSVSGGVDFYRGALHGVRFGVHELGGVRIDIDNAARDVLANDLGGLDQAIGDMEKISIPVTWVHGKHDGWMDLDRVRRLLSAGDVGNRRLIEVPTGHQLRTSREALETFQLVSEEASRMLLGTPLRGTAPDLVKLESRQREERSRVPKRAVDLVKFWHDYILGRDETIGMQLLTATSEYEEFMSRQIDRLGLHAGHTVLDLGSGTGELARHIGLHGDAGSIHLVALDIVRQALRRLVPQPPSASSLSGVVANLECSAFGIPIASNSADAVLASLLVSYLENPVPVLDEIVRVLRPGARLVVSAPRRDADLSGLYRTVRRQLSAEVVRTRFGADVSDGFEEIQRRHLNEAAKLVSLEEEGRFAFYDADELVQLVRAAGLVDVASELVLGSPPQVVLVTAAKP